MTDAERLTELEIRIAYLEDTLAALDEVITGQANQIDGMVRLNRTLSEHIKSLLERMDDIKPSPDESRPPHY